MTQEEIEEELTQIRKLQQDLDQTKQVLAERMKELFKLKNTRPCGHPKVYEFVQAPGSSSFEKRLAFCGVCGRR